MSLEVEGVVEALAAEGAEVALHVAVALHVPVEEPLEGEALCAQVTREARRLAILLEAGSHLQEKTLVRKMDVEKYESVEGGKV